MGGKRVSVVGLHPDVVCYADPAYVAFPGFNVDKLATLLEQDRMRLCTEGFDAIWSFWEKKPTPEQTFLDALATHRPDAVLIGAGMRFNPALTELF